jgi:pimeloyl-ACP methyl ester carboxylesterase
MIAPLAKLIDWSAIQVLARMPTRNEESSRLAEALQLLKGPDYIPTESEPARVEFDDDKSGLHFRFVTPRRCEFEENNVVYGRLYRCGERWRERPAIILLHGAGDWLGYRFRYPVIARRCNRAGFNAVTLAGPYHFQRRPRQPGAMRWPNYLRLAEATAQAVAEIRALTGWLLREGCPAVALWGFSLGARLAGVTACSEPRLAAAVLAAPSVRLNVSFAEVILWPRIRKAFQSERAAWEALNATPFNLSLSQPMIPKRNVLLIKAMYDLFVGCEGIEELWRAWGEPEIWRLPQGHVGKALVPGLTGRVLRWLTPRLNEFTIESSEAREEAKI